MIKLSQTPVYELSRRHMPVVWTLDHASHTPRCCQVCIPSRDGMIKLSQTPVYELSHWHMPVVWTLDRASHTPRCCRVCILLYHNETSISWRLPDSPGAILVPWSTAMQPWRCIPGRDDKTRPDPSLWAVAAITPDNTSYLVTNMMPTLFISNIHCIYLNRTRNTQTHTTVYCLT